MPRSEDEGHPTPVTLTRNLDESRWLCVALAPSLDETRQRSVTLSRNPDEAIGRPRPLRELAQVLKPRCNRLHVVQGELRRVASELNASRKEKNRAIEAHKEIFLWVARGAESLFQLAGERELAERIRPSTRRPGRRAVEVADDKKGESEAGTSPAEGTQAEDSAAVAAGEAGSQPTAPPVAAPALESAPASPSTDG